MAIASVNPANGMLLRTYSPLSDSELEAKVEKAWRAFEILRRTSFAERAGWMLRAAEILEAEKQAFGAMMTMEMGKTLASAVEEAAKCATACRYYAEHAESLLRSETVEVGGPRAAVRYEPLGPVLAVMPWNFPFWQVFRFAAPALMAGNTGLLKHAGNVPQCALAIEDIFRRAGFPEGAFQALLAEAEAVEGLLNDDRIAAATLTGSEAAGSAVAAAAGKRIKKTVLELGGSDPFIVMPSADLDQAVAAAVRSRTVNNGQSCIAAKRFIVDGSIYRSFEEKFTAEMAALRVGDPMEATTEVGPLATEKIRDGLDTQVRRAADAGARILTGGKSVPGAGYYYEPTVLAGVDRHSPVYREEFFGPVAMLFRANGAEEAIALANDTPFGLGAGVWTRDTAEQELFIDRITAGMVFVNAMVASDTRLPFGGVKRSGYGRELGAFGIREFVNAKTVRWG